MIKLYVIRHATTGAEEQKITLGTIDWPLNLSGIESVKEFSKDYKFSDIKIDLIIASPLKRAVETADIISKGLNIPTLIDPLLSERNFGELEGLTWEEFANKYPDLVKSNSENYQPNLPGGESIEQVEIRVKTFIQKIKDEFDGKNIFIVTHTGIIRILKRLLANESTTSSRKNIKNLEITSFIIN